MKLFLPGRICLFGEHSDWAGGYRRINAELEKGYAIIAGTNQGIYAEIKPHPSRLIIRSTLNDGTKTEPFEIPMDRGELLKEAQKGGYFSYAAGVAYQVLTHYRVNGLEIDNTATDLPIKKGLSSSAAICVLVARAFNRIYNLKMTIRGEMEFAYMGEITTPSRCGRMDQGCAYGNRPILMTFDGDWIDVRELKLSKNLYFVLVDLCAGKDTKEILAKLNQGYPFAENDVQRAVQNYLGPINAGITNKAVEMIEAGNAEEIGKLMKKAQEEFDKNCIPICPSQLTAPVLHKVLNYEPIQPFILGGKGVGSQGDGAAQFIVKDEESQNKVIEIMEKNLKLPCLKLTLETGRKVRKALIPAAGFGTRLFPASKAMKKELFPVIGKDGRIKPAILTIVEEAISAGIEEIGIIIQPADRAIFEEFFFMPPTIENFNKLSKENQAYSEYLLDVGHRITLIEQKIQDGFGHAVYCSREWIGNEPFLLMLGDHIYALSDVEKSCARQIMDVFEKRGQSVVGLRETPENEVRHYGCAAGIWDIEGDEITVTEFYEKPDAEYARKHMHIKGMKDDVYLTVFGQYILTPKIFEYLEEDVLHNNRKRGEFQLTSCLDKLRQEEGFAGCMVKGRRFDIGLPEAYRQTIIDFRNA
ncbi:MAG: GHMP kinase [Candidatus Goldbacteria bacterium]|nr:GHMP kinase [Candidatus Goldiibacteriota bacterium]